MHIYIYIYIYMIMNNSPTATPLRTNVNIIINNHHMTIMKKYDDDAYNTNNEKE